MSSGLTLNRVEVLIQDGVTIFFEIAGVIIVGFMIYAGFLIMTAGGDTKRYDQGKRMLYQTIIGAAVVLGVGIIANTIANFAQGPTQILR